MAGLAQEQAREGINHGKGKGKGFFLAREGFFYQLKLLRGAAPGKPKWFLLGGSAQV